MYFIKKHSVAVEQDEFVSVVQFRLELAFSYILHIFFIYFKCLGVLMQLKFSS